MPTPWCIGFTRARRWRRSRRRFPGTTAGGKVDRNKLAARVLGDHAALKRLEAIVHPLVQEAESRLLAEAEARGEKVAVLDIPLLFGDRRRCGGSTRWWWCRRRLRFSARACSQRPGMTMEKLEAILASRCRTPKSAGVRILSWTPRAARAPRAAQVRAILDAIATMPKRRR